MKIKGFLTFLLLVSISGVVLAQGQQQGMGGASGPPMQMKPGNQGRMGAGGGMMGQGGMPMMQMMSMMQNMHPAIAVDDTAVYVIRGSQVLKLNKDTLQVIATGMLPPPPAEPMRGMDKGQGMGSMSQRGMGGARGGGMMDDMSRAPAGQFDERFLQNMTRHHAGAIATSRMAVRKATHPELRRFARDVVDSQYRQNKQFSIWLREWYQKPARPMLAAADQKAVATLRDLKGRDFEIEYMKAMIKHHEDGVKMAQMAEQKATHPELKTAASKIVSVQSSEISKLRDWLSAWYGVRE